MFSHQRFSGSLQRAGFFAVIVSVVLSLHGCGGKKVAPSKPSELEIPPDLVKAFEVKDFDVTQKTTPVTPAVAGAPEMKGNEKPTLPEKKTAKSKKAKAKEAAVAAGASNEVQGMIGPRNVGLKIPNRRPKFDPIWVGEKIAMDVTWLATKAGEFWLEVLPFKEINNRKVYHLKGLAKTSDLFAMVYKAEDYVESFVDYLGWFPYKFVLHGDETKHIRNNLELFDHAAQKQYVHIHDFRTKQNEVHEDKGYKDLTPFSQDGLSALYYARTMALTDGARITFPVTTNGSQFETQLVVLGREEVSTRMGTRRAIKTKVETMFKGVLQQQGDSFIWFSDDERKFPLRFEAKVKIGWISGIAKKIDEGTREPVAPETAQILEPTVPTGILPAEPGQPAAGEQKSKVDSSKKRASTAAVSAGRVSGIKKTGGKKGTVAVKAEASEPAAEAPRSLFQSLLNWK